MKNLNLVNEIIIEGKRMVGEGIVEGVIIIIDKLKFKRKT